MKRLHMQCHPAQTPSDRNRKSCSASLPTLRASPTSQSQICKFEDSEMETGSFGTCHFGGAQTKPSQDSQKQGLSRTHTSPIWVGLIYSLLLLQPNPQRMQRDKVLQDYYSVPTAPVINTKEEREKADRMVCKLTRGIY